MRTVLKGIPVSPGVACARLVKWTGPEEVPARREPEPTDLFSMRKAWREAVESTAGLLDKLCARTAREAGEEQAQIFAAQKMMVEDPSLEGRVFCSVEAGKTLTSAVEEVMDGLAGQFELLEDAYMRERAADIRDIAGRLLGHLRGAGTGPALDAAAVLAARDLAPSQTAALEKSRLKGIALEAGGRTSHTVILARALDIPAVIGAAGVLQAEGQDILIDGDTGTLIIDPSGEDLRQYEDRLQQSAGATVALTSHVLTADGATIQIAANIGSADELAVARKYGVGGVGLCRTEFLYLEAGRPPGEDEQFEAYRRVAAGAAPYSVIFRTLDIGGDKELPGLGAPGEANPFLGLRGLRLCLAHPDVFQTQLRALLRASVYGQVRIMFPMVDTVEEYREAMDHVRIAQESLTAGGKPFSSETRFGIMVETPAAALNADALAREVDFFSIGTNDLIQYTMAADRLNDRVAYLYQPFHPAVLRLIGQVIEAAHRLGKDVGMCGEMAGMPESVPLLCGMGLDEFSMSPSSAPRVREILAKTNRKDAFELARQVQLCATADQVIALLRP